MRIVYIGPIAKPGMPAIGGYEAANRKNIDTLKKRGIDVVEIANPLIKHQYGSIAKLAYVKLLFIPFKLLRYRHAKETAIHTTPLYKNLLWPSVLTVWAAKRLRLPVVVDIRAGSLIKLVKMRSSLWRRGVRYMLNAADAITAEGKSYVKDIPATFGVEKEIHYLPNITFCDQSTFTPRKEEHINMIYFGRITKHKGVDLLLDMMEQLDDRYRLYLAGHILSDISAEEIKREKVIYLGALTHEELFKQLAHMHIFLFPTKWFGEGQSNSLIEAMQQGLIPIASDHGFNKDVVSDSGVILPTEADATQYAAAVAKVAKGDLNAMGQNAMEHIKEHHNIDNWIEKLITIYKEIIPKS